MTKIIQISDDIKEEIAKRVVEQAHPGYTTAYMGQWYVVDGTSVQHKESTAPWNPWHDSANVIAVDDLVNIYGGADQDNADFHDYESDKDDEEAVKEGREIAIEFALGYVPDSYDADDYETRYE